VWVVLRNPLVLFESVWNRDEVQIYYGQIGQAQADIRGIVHVYARENNLDECDRASDREDDDRDALRSAYCVWIR
jgi:hypothetical protein